MDTKYQDITIENFRTKKKIIIREIKITDIKFIDGSILITFSDYLGKINREMIPMKDHTLTID